MKKSKSKPKERKPVVRYSPCAIKCSHQWCDGYSAGYEDGKVDAEERRWKPLTPIKLPS